MAGTKAAERTVVSVALPPLSSAKGPVVVGYVGTARCAPALLWAADAAAAAGVPLRIVHAYGVRTTSDAAGSYPRSHQAARRAADARVSEAAAIVREAHPDLVIELVTAVGRPAAVLQRASQGGYMLVVSTRRQSYVHQLLGSVTNRVTGRVTCPVMSLPGPARD